MNKGVLLLLVVLMSVTVSEAWLARRLKRWVTRRLNPFRRRRHYPYPYPHPYPYPYYTGKRAIEAMDTNGDGILDETELQNANKRDVEALSKLLNLDSKPPFTVEDLKHELGEVQQ